MGSTKITATPDEINQALDGISANVTAANLSEVTGGEETDLHSHAASGGGSGPQVLDRKITSAELLLAGAAPYPPLALVADPAADEWLDVERITFRSRNSTPYTGSGTFQVQYRGSMQTVGGTVDVGTYLAGTDTLGSQASTWGSASAVVQGLGLELTFVSSGDDVADGTGVLDLSVSYRVRAPLP